MAGSRTALVLIDFQEWILRDLAGAGGTPLTPRSWP
jgi:hypothetical protein